MCWGCNESLLPGGGGYNPDIIITIIKTAQRSLIGIKLNLPLGENMHFKTHPKETGENSKDKHIKTCEKIFPFTNLVFRRKEQPSAWVRFLCREFYDIS